MTAGSAAQPPRPSIPWPSAPAIAKLDVGQGNHLQEYMERTKLHKQLGKGRFGTVYSASNDSGSFAVKVLYGGDIDTKEAFFMKQLDGCPHILQLQNAIINPFYTILQFPAMDSDLVSYLLTCKGHVMPKSHQLTAAKHLVNALSFLTEKFIHRDLHDQNVTWCSTLRSAVFVKWC